MSSWALGRGARGAGASSPMNHATSEIELPTVESGKLLITLLP